jgi:hypothetical protein
MNVVNAKLAAEDARSPQDRQPVTTFVSENFDNVLAPYVFINTCMSRYEVAHARCLDRDIMSKATPKIQERPKVKEYYQAAQENQNIMNGMKDVPQTAPTQPMAPPQDGPTPNQMAAPAGQAPAPAGPAGGGE